MGTTRIKVIDLSSSQKEIKTSRKHAEKLAGPSKKEPKAKPGSSQPQLQESGQVQQQEPGKPNEPEQILDAAQQVEEKAPSAKQKKTKKQKHHLGANYKHARELVENKFYSTKEALELLPKTSFVKFDPAVEVHLGVSEKNIRGKVNFPHAKDQKKKEKRYLVFADKKSPDENKNVIWAGEKTIEELENGKLKPTKDFDVVIASPSFMPALAKVAKILGPRGMMPNPKNGTVTQDFQKFVDESSSSTSYEFKADPSAQVVHVKIGKLSQKPEELAENLKALTLSIGTSKIKKAWITTTMGPAIKLDTSSLI
jgi:large subunit ribosomal protein L1